MFIQRSLSGGNTVTGNQQTFFKIKASQNQENSKELTLLLHLPQFTGTDTPIKKFAVLHAECYEIN